MQLQPGRTPTITASEIEDVVRKATEAKPDYATRWSPHAMAEASGISEKSMRRIWHKHGLKPQLMHSFKVKFAEKLESIGLYLNPPEHAIVLRDPRLLTKRNADFVCSLNTLNGAVIGMCDDRRRHQDWLKFLCVIDSVTPQESKVQRWLSRHPRFHIYFTPTSSSWLNMVERFFRDLTQIRLLRGIFRDVEDLITSLGDYIDKLNDKPKPFIRTAKASGIPGKVKRART
jgi:hypothetical protein